MKVRSSQTREPGGPHQTTMPKAEWFGCDTLPSGSGFTSPEWKLHSSCLSYVGVFVVCTATVSSCFEMKLKSIRKEFVCFCVFEKVLQVQDEIVKIHIVRWQELLRADGWFFWHEIRFLILTLCEYWLSWPKIIFLDPLMFGCLTKHQGACVWLDLDPNIFGQDSQYSHNVWSPPPGTQTKIDIIVMMSNQTCIPTHEKLLSLFAVDMILGPMTPKPLKSHFDSHNLTIMPYLVHTIQTPNSFPKHHIYSQQTFLALSENFENFHVELASQPMLSKRGVGGQLNMAMKW